MKPTRSSAPEAARCAVVAGASGLVGSELLRQLAARRADLPYSQRIALVRQALPAPLAGVKQARLDFSRLAAELDGLRLAAGFDLFCCLGTTRAQAGSAAAFQRVDRDLVLELGRWAARAGARRMLVVSSIGADAGSRSLYSRTKGEMEAGLRGLGLASLVVFRPSLLAGERAQHRPGEALALRLAQPLARWIPAGWRPVAAGDVAAAMIEAALATRPPAVMDSAAMQGAAARA